MKIVKDVVIKRPDGIHARPAGDLVKRMNAFDSTVSFVYKDQEINGKSILQVMKLAIKQGEVLQVIIDGTDAEDTFASLEEFLNEGLY